MIGEHSATERFILDKMRSLYAWPTYSSGIHRKEEYIMQKEFPYTETKFYISGCPGGCKFRPNDDITFSTRFHQQGTSYCVKQ